MHRRSRRQLVPLATWRRWTKMATSGTRGRSDDMFRVAGYHISPSEIENCLVKHPGGGQRRSRAQAGRRARLRSSRSLCRARRRILRWRAVDRRAAGPRARQLAPYEYPKEIEFIDAADDGRDAATGAESREGARAAGGSLTVGERLRRSLAHTSRVVAAPVRAPRRRPKRRRARSASGAWRNDAAAGAGLEAGRRSSCARPGRSCGRRGQVAGPRVRSTAPPSAAAARRMIVGR